MRPLRLVAAVPLVRSVAGVAALVVGAVRLLIFEDLIGDDT